jgi:hypothetical protein
MSNINSTRGSNSNKSSCKTGCCKTGCGREKGPYETQANRTKRIVTKGNNKYTDKIERCFFMCNKTGKQCVNKANKTILLPESKLFNILSVHKMKTILDQNKVKGDTARNYRRFMSIKSNSNSNLKSNKIYRKSKKSLGSRLYNKASRAASAAMGPGVIPKKFKLCECHLNELEQNYGNIPKTIKGAIGVITKQYGPQIAPYVYKQIMLHLSSPAIVDAQYALNELNSHQ